ncbi:MAG: RluA family pseudouridine synthase [Helicobacteraceae bacterium]|jgi:RluA family pseudouridine synthase|nr:RluA family pseudouridine synthase [Helicobacteraceae bacterium]
MKDKAYKVLATQKGISNNEAKRLIDNAQVFFEGKRLTIARMEIDRAAVLKVIDQKEPVKIYEDDDLLAVDKPAGAECYDLEKKFGFRLIHRLDKPTSGVLLLAKNETFLESAIREFRKRLVEKKYLAVVEAIVAEERRIDLPVFTQKGAKAKSEVDKKRGLAAVSVIKPLRIEGRRTMLEVSIETGRTHQIRVHLSYIGLPILGDESYGGKPYKRLMLHASSIALLNREIKAQTPVEFNDLFR